MDTPLGYAFPLPLLLRPQDGNAMLWDLNEAKHLYTLNGGDVINSLVFSPNRSSTSCLSSLTCQCASVPFIYTGTGCVLPLDQLSRYGYVLLSVLLTQFHYFSSSKSAITPILILSLLKWLPASKASGFRC